MIFLFLKAWGEIGFIGVRLTPCGHFVVTLEISSAGNLYRLIAFLLCFLGERGGRGAEVLNVRLMDGL